MRLLRHLPLVVGLVLFAGWLIFLRPTALGGPANYVVVSGSSMEPTLMPGDLVITREHQRYDVGEVAVYGIPEGQPGENSSVEIVHRLVGGDDEQGFETKGDNLRRPDVWTPRHADIKGTLWFHVPNAGGWLLVLLSPVVVGALSALVTMVIVLKRSSRDLRRA